MVERTPVRTPVVQKKAGKKPIRPAVRLQGFSLLKDNPIFSNPPGYLDTGSVLLNLWVSGSAKGGWPFGKVIELYGDPSTGKSLIAYQALAAAQAAGGFGVLDDVENAFDPSFGKKVGVDIQALRIGSSDTVEEAFSNTAKAIEALVGAGIPRAVFVLDSLGMLSSKHEQEVGYEKKDMSKASLIRQGTRMVNKILSKSGYLLIVLNHTIANVGVMYGPKKTTPGGSGVPFIASVRVELSYPKMLEGNPPPGVVSRFKVSKNKISAPFGKGLFRVFFNRGLDRNYGIGEALLSSDVLEEVKKGWVTLVGGSGESYQLSRFSDKAPVIAKAEGFGSVEDMVDSLLAAKLEVATDECSEAVEDDE